jgi:DNA-binding transcriptional ArsR family regulator
MDVTMTTHALDALGSPIRRDILRRLQRSPLAVNEIAAKFPVSRPAISRHLKVLEEAGLVEKERGARGLYSVRLDGFTPVREFLDEFWDVALARLADLSRHKGRSS